jgi:hypothetical protein
MTLEAAFIATAGAFVHYWAPRYPSAGPWIDDGAKQAIREAEDAWLCRFAGKIHLTRNDVSELIDWKWQGYAAKRSRSHKGVDADWTHAERRIRSALIEDDLEAAVDELRGTTGGIPQWQCAMSSVVLTACHPNEFTVVDSYSLRSMMLLEGKSLVEINRMTYFDRRFWPKYIRTCRDLTDALSISLRTLDRALVTSRGRPAP